MPLQLNTGQTVKVKGPDGATLSVRITALQGSEKFVGVRVDLDGVQAQGVYHVDQVIEVEYVPPTWSVGAAVWYNGRRAVVESPDGQNGMFYWITLLKSGGRKSVDGRTLKPRKDGDPDPPADSINPSPVFSDIDDDDTVPIDKTYGFKPGDRVTFGRSIGVVAGPLDKDEYFPIVLDNGATTRVAPYTLKARPDTDLDYDELFAAYEALKAQGPAASGINELATMQRDYKQLLEELIQMKRIVAEMRAQDPGAGSGSWKTIMVVPSETVIDDIANSNGRKVKAAEIVVDGKLYWYVSSWTPAPAPEPGDGPYNGYTADEATEMVEAAMSTSASPTELDAMRGQAATYQDDDIGNRQRAGDAEAFEAGRTKFVLAMSGKRRRIQSVKSRLKV